MIKLCLSLSNGSKKYTISRVYKFYMQTISIYLYYEMETRKRLKGIFTSLIEDLVGRK